MLKQKSFDRVCDFRGWYGHLPTNGIEPMKKLCEQASFQACVIFPKHSMRYNVIKAIGDLLRQNTSAVSFRLFRICYDVLKSFGALSDRWHFWHADHFHNFRIHEK